MTMTITFDLSPEQEARLKESIARHDSESVREILTDAIELTVKSLLERNESEELSTEEFEALADELADYFAESMPPDAKPLSDYAMSREGIYEDHP